MSPAPWLLDLERALADDEGTEVLATGLVVLATVAGRDVHLDADEARGAVRRALLLLSTGGDPGRGLDLHDRPSVVGFDDVPETRSFSPPPTPSDRTATPWPSGH